MTTKKAPKPPVDALRVGEFEQLVLLAVLQLGDDAYGIQVREALVSGSGREVARGALYRTLERLENKGLVDWVVSESTPERGGIPRRRFRVTTAGLISLRHARRVLLHFWHGLEQVLR